MSTEKQIAANQANALKSTGPKSAEGKAKARRNAIKHGMTCEKENLYSRDAKLFRERLESWTKTAKPQNDMELYQIESAVRATVNLDACARNAAAATKRRSRGVVGHWDGAQTKKLNRATEFWTNQPADCIAELETFARGCAWLLECWELLAQALEANHCWNVDEAWTASRLLGRCPEMVHEGDGELAAFRMLMVAALPEFDADEVDALLGIDTTSLEPDARQAQLRTKLPSREDALEGLWATLGAEMERVEQIRAALWQSQDGPKLEEKINLVAFDHSKTGVLRRRYESANHLDMHRCLKQFTEQRSLRDGRLEESRQLEEQAKAEKKAERDAAFRKAAEKFREARRLQNEAKSSEVKDTPISTSGKSGDVDTREITDPARPIEKVIRPTEAAPEGVHALNPGESGAGEGHKTA